MLKIIKTMKDLDMKQIYSVYEESIALAGKQDYPNEVDGMRILLAEQDAYSSWLQFFRDPNAICALWTSDGTYRSALRLDRYRDGYLLNSLETVPAARGNGSATALINAVIQYLKVKQVHKVYSHIDKSNVASIAVHTSCGFKRISDHAVYLDGSVLRSSNTYLYEIAQEPVP